MLGGVPADPPICAVIVVVTGAALPAARADSNMAACPPLRV